VAAAAEVESSLATPPDPTAAAFFDVDNTIMQGASIFHLARGLHRRKFFTTRDLGRFADELDALVVDGFCRPGEWAPIVELASESFNVAAAAPLN